MVFTDYPPSNAGSGWRWVLIFYRVCCPLDHAAAIIWRPIALRFHGFERHPLLPKFSDHVGFSVLPDSGEDPDNDLGISQPIAAGSLPSSCWAFEVFAKIIATRIYYSRPLISPWVLMRPKPIEKIYRCYRSQKSWAPLLLCDFGTMLPAPFAAPCTPKLS
ncbi:hypothetical protein ACLOJK_036992 [Asimina triloba]